MSLSTVLLCGLVILKVVKSSYQVYFDISIINDENGERYVLFRNVDVQYWSIVQYVTLHSLFEKYMSKYGLCHLEVRPCYNETY